MDRKPDADEIDHFIDQLSRQMRQRWPGNFRSHWPGYVFHVTHIHAAVSILRSGRLVSRTRARRDNLMDCDVGSPDIIAHTDAGIQDSVRLYFRPLTPTFFHSEGVRAEQHRSALGSHCPVPMAFVFDAKGLLGREGTSFTDGNASSPRATKGSSAAFLRDLPFDLIYHHGRIPADQSEEITLRRCAKILVPDEVPLNRLLRHISVRSLAEYETFVSLLRQADSQAGQESLRYLGVNRRSPLFFKRWTFVETVEVIEDRAIFVFNPDTESPGPFVALLEFSDPVTGKILFRQSISGFMAFPRLDYSLPNNVRASDFLLRVYLDGHIVYQNAFFSPHSHAIVPPSKP